MALADAVKAGEITWDGGDKLAVQLEQQTQEKQQIQTRFDAELEQLRRLWPQPEPR